MSADAMPPFLHSSGPWQQARVWLCGECGEHGDVDSFDDNAPREHVASKGHTVIIQQITEMTIFPVRTKPPG